MTQQQIKGLGFINKYKQYAVNSGNDLHAKNAKIYMNQVSGIYGRNINDGSFGQDNDQIFTVEDSQSSTR